MMRARELGVLYIGFRLNVALPTNALALLRATLSRFRFFPSGGQESLYTSKKNKGSVGFPPRMP